MAANGPCEAMCSAVEDAAKCATQVFDRIGTDESRLEKSEIVKNGNSHTNLRLIVLASAANQILLVVKSHPI